jgi:FG-GAP-like repeat/ASPIC and UnbV
MAHFGRCQCLASLALLAASAWAQPANAQIAFDNVSQLAGFGGSASETWGASWGDYNGDNYPDVFFNNHRNRATLYRNDGDGTFTEVSAQVDGSSTPGWTGGRANVDTHGVAWADVDNDGDDDLYQAVDLGVDMFHTNRLGVLTDRSAAFGIDKLRHAATRQPLFLDFNRDGRLDLAVVALTLPSLYPRLADGTFGAAQAKSMACWTDGQWAHLVDVYPTDGLELLCAPRNGTYPKVNAFPNGTITNVTGDFPQFPSVIDVATLDYNRDLRPDLFLVKGTERPSDAFQLSPYRFEAQFITGANTKSVRFRTTGTITVSASLSTGTDPQGDPAYIDIGSIQWSPSTLVFPLSSAYYQNWGIATGSQGINIGYLTDTGEWEIRQGGSGFKYAYVQVSSTTSISNLTFDGSSAADRGQKPLLVRNTGSGLATTTNAGFGAALRCQSAVSGDFDNDMDEDLFLACTGGAHNLPNRLFRNNGNGTFTEIGAGEAAGRVGAAVASNAGTSESVVSADYDVDGFLDLLVTNGNNMRPVYFGGPKQLFRNRGNANHWLELDLVGTASNRDGVGSKVYVTSGNVKQYREQNGGYHRWSQNFTRIHVGLGPNTRADVTVVWPNGARRTYWGLYSNRLYKLKQDGTFARVWL